MSPGQLLPYLVDLIGNSLPEHLDERAGALPAALLADSGARQRERVWPGWLRVRQGMYPVNSGRDAWRNG